MSLIAGKDNPRITVWLPEIDRSWLKTQQKRIEGYGKACEIRENEKGYIALFYTEGYYAPVTDGGCMWLSTYGGIHEDC